MREHAKTRAREHLRASAVVACRRCRVERRRHGLGGSNVGETQPHRPSPPSQTAKRQMDEEGVPSTTLREVSLLKMLSESNHIVK